MVYHCWVNTCQVLAASLMLVWGRTERGPLYDEGWVLDLQPQSKTTLITWCLSFRCSEDPKLWALGGTRNHHCSIKPTGIYFFPERPPQLPAASQRGG